MKEYLESAKSGKSRAGKTDLINHLSGKRLTQRQAIKAKCFDCNGLGEEDTCEMVHCSLFPYSPYRKSPGLHVEALRRAKKAF